MEQDSWLETIGLLVMICVIFCLIAIPPFMMGRRIGYKRGQIDALKGEVGYELVEQPDSTLKWEEVESAEKTTTGER